MSSIAVAVIGLGYWGSKIAGVVDRTPGLRLSWLVDENRKSLNRVGKIFPGVETTDNVAQVFADGETEAVAICTPAGTHHRLAMDALAAGKALFVEKPLTLSSKDGREVVARAKEQKQTLMVGHTFLFNQAILDASEIIREGFLGEILHLSFTRTNLGPIRSDTNAVWDLASHDVAIALSVLGRKPRVVSARGSSWVSPPRQDTGSVWMEFENNTSCQIDVSWLSPERERKLQIIGSKAMLTFDDADQTFPLKLHTKRAITRQRRGKKITPTQIVDEGLVNLNFIWSEPLANELKAFELALREKTAPKSDGAFGLEVVEVLEAIQESLDSDGKNTLVTDD